MFSNTDIKWQSFPESIEGVVSHFGQFQTIMAIKCSKATTEDDPNGVIFGMLYTTSGDADDLNFTGSKWCSYCDCYHSIKILPKQSYYLENASDNSSISKEISIEDINEYHVIEFIRIGNNHEDSPIYNPPVSLNQAKKDA